MISRMGALKNCSRPTGSLLGTCRASHDSNRDKIPDTNQSSTRAVAMDTACQLVMPSTENGGSARVNQTANSENPCSSHISGILATVVLEIRQTVPPSLSGMRWT